ncbi:MAG: D-alanine--D-alanine ligase A, partial [Planctomycetes bacterium]|nr:D-alanine--D-alanine ligase A [Planctomycetota bacterium]
MPKQRFAVLLGGVSDEREISFQSGIMVIRALLASGHGVRPWLVEADGAFTLGRELEGETAADQLATQRGFAADALDLARRGTALETAQELRAWQPDCVFIALHGPGGEDGAIQGFLQWAGLPYTGCDVAASALGMNKVAWKALVTTCGLPTAPWTVLTAHEWNHERQSALDTG